MSMMVLAVGAMAQPSTPQVKHTLTQTTAPNWDERWGLLLFKSDGYGQCRAPVRMGGMGEDAVPNWIDGGEKKYVGNL